MERIKMYYGISSRDYLKRAYERLNGGKPESLFYAAFELRCGIESRMQAYLGAQEFVSKSKKEEWNIVKLGKNIEQTFKKGDKVIEIAIIDIETESVLDKFYYTPVASELRMMRGKLGDILHAMKEYKNEDDEWWDNTRRYLEDICQELIKANVGTLLGPPLIKKETGQINMNTEILEDNDPDLIISKYKLGGQILFKAQYFDELPADVRQSELYAKK
ncbi:MAG: hypothetical protein ACYDIA_15170 [Candidatus Humimicrobiaceae bacterium]